MFANYCPYTNIPYIVYKMFDMGEQVSENEILNQRDRQTAGGK